MRKRLIKIINEQNGASYPFDARDNLTMIGAGMTFKAGYTSEGVRAWKQSGTSRTYFLYDGADSVVEMDGNGAVKAVNTFGVAGIIVQQNVATATHALSTRLQAVHRRCFRAEAVGDKTALLRGFAGNAPL